MNGNFFTLDEFNDAMRKIEPVFHVGQRLPGQVFKRLCQFHLLCEFNFAMDDLQQALETTRSPLADDTVLLCALDPDPITFYYKEFHKICGVYFKANFSIAEYLHMLWLEVSPGDEPSEFLFTELEVYLPELESWAMWGERSRDIACSVSMTRRWRHFSSTKPAIGWMPRPHCAGLPGCRLSTKRFRRISGVALIANYGSRADLERKLRRKVEYPWEKEEATPHR